MPRNEGLISAYLDAFLEVNKAINLTRITAYEQANLLQVEDSLAHRQLCE